MASTALPKYAKLIGKRILVIGGTSGIGFAVAEACIESQAATVTVSSSNSARVERAVGRLKASYGASTVDIKGFACDLGNPETLEDNLKNLLLHKSGPLDHIIYTAGDRLSFKPVSELNISFISTMATVRFHGPLLIAKYAMHILPPTATSSLTLTTGAVSEKPIPGGWSVQAAYGAALHGMTRGLALELAPIRVNLVSPGPVDTELWDHLSTEEHDKVLDKMAQGTLTGHIGQPEDVAEAYVYLMKDANVTGHLVSTSSGVLLK